MEATEICGITPLLVGNLRKAYISLHELGAPVFVRNGDKEQHFFISGESGEKSYGWCDFYGSGDPYSNNKLDAVLKPLGLGWDWENPGCIMVYND